MMETNPMKTGTVNSADLGDSLAASDHLPARPRVVVMEAQYVRTGDRIRVQQHISDGESRPWHDALVGEVQPAPGAIHMEVDTWPVVYVSAPDTLVQVLAMDRTVNVKCVICRTVTPVRATLDDYASPAVFNRTGLAVVIIEPDTTDAVRGYCDTHADAVLS